jgi:UDP-N-acetyl-D-glucosamine dehydrogenase
MPDDSSVICVVGLGYVGLPLAVAFASAGRSVVGFDSAPARIGELQRGHSGVEDVADDQLAALRGRLRFSSEIADAVGDTYLLCVPTPLAGHEPDLTAVRAASAAVAKVLKPGDLVVLESTSYPGTTEDLVGSVLREISGLDFRSDFHLAFSPERIDPANPSFNVRNTPKVVGGATAEAGDRAEALYAQVTEQVIRVSGTREAEMTKLLENTYRHVNIALVNELAIYCHALDVDIWEVISAASTKPFGFMPFTPGPGVGGHCIPVDPSYLSWAVRQMGHQFRLVELAQDVNSRMPAYVVQRLAAMLNERGLALSRSRVLCVGLAYKPNVADTRESPALQVVELLVASGVDVVCHDPHVESVTVGGRLLTSTPLESVGSVDLTVVLTAHDDIQWHALPALDSTPVLDTRGALPRSTGVHRL